ncbi:MAG: BatA domain-containing protein [Polaribacter sp.]|nr:BatA domain-containing protein [Polaribacter sp.]MDB4168022.1 BatA domain-containing protein [Polaribacter sp.]
MQFKNPDILYFLVLLIIPILVHLFHLQKFTKVSFTNVAFLQKIIQQNRKSSRLKKWLLLCVRMLLFSAILFAFSQPYFSENEADKKQEHFIYLDTSLSLNSKGDKGDLLKVAVQEIIENTSDKNSYTLQTNSDYYPNISKSELKNILQKVKTTSEKIAISTILLKIRKLHKNKSNTLGKNILISDFQNNYEVEFTNVTPPISIVKLETSTQNNVSIDSVYIASTSIDKTNLKVVVRNQGTKKNNIPITLYNDQKLISKQTFSIEKNGTYTIDFSIDKGTQFLGKIQITLNDTFTFDNRFNFALNSNEKINVLSIGKETDFLSKIYTKKEFIYTHYTPEEINFNAIQKQQLILLNALENITPTVQNSLLEFSKKGGSIVLIPNNNLDLDSYRSFFKKLTLGNIDSKIEKSLKITDINFDHPFFKSVFYKQVQNFQYPNSKNHFPTSFVNSSNLISYENKEGFIKKVPTKNGNLFWIAAALDSKNSNFINSPLVVPVFYNFAQLSLQPSRMYYSLGVENKIDVKTTLYNDEILSIKSIKNTFIPRQQHTQNKVTITTLEQPEVTDLYYITNKKDTLKTLAFNNPKDESSMTFLNTKSLAKNNKNISTSNSIKEHFQEINEKSEVHWLWKWFLTLAIVSLLLEILILKFFKS